MSDEIYLKEPATVSVLAVMTEHSRDTVFYDSNGDEYLRIGADNVPADVYERFTSWCMHLPPVHDAEVRRLTNERDAMREQLRWRSWPDEKPEASGLLLVDYLSETGGALLCNTLEYDQGYNEWDYGELENSLVQRWLPIPQDNMRPVLGGAGVAKWDILNYRGESNE